MTERLECLYAIRRGDRIEDGAVVLPNGTARDLLTTLDRQGEVLFACIRPERVGQPCAHGTWRVWTLDEEPSEPGFLLSEWPEPIALVRGPEDGVPLLRCLPVPLAVCVSEAVKVSVR